MKYDISCPKGILETLPKPSDNCCENLRILPEDILQNEDVSLEYGDEDYQKVLYKRGLLICGRSTGKCTLELEKINDDGTFLWVCDWNWSAVKTNIPEYIGHFNKNRGKLDD